MTQTDPHSREMGSLWLADHGEVLRRVADRRRARVARTGRPELRLTQHEMLSSAHTAMRLSGADVPARRDEEYRP